MSKEINAAGLAIIKKFEGRRLKAYRCPAGIWTIGYGHTGDVHEGMEITEEQAEELLRGDIMQAEMDVERLVMVPINSNQFSALVSFTYNVGVQAFKISTLLNRINAGRLQDVSGEIIKWRYANGKELNGLRRRREAERNLFLTEEAAQ